MRNARNVSSPNRPRLRSIESVIVPDPVHGRALMLRDSEGIAPDAVVMPASFADVLARFDGVRTTEQIAAEATREASTRGRRASQGESGGRAGPRIEAAFVEKLASQLDEAYMLDSPRFRARRAEVIGAFARAPVRAATHAGGAYHGEASALARYIEEECLAKAPARKPRGRMVGVCSPHMDLWRCAAGYGHAYRACAEALPEDVDTFILLGTCHAPMRRPFTICAKTFATPLGPLEPDTDALRKLASASRFDVEEEQYLHKSEHSLEFQAVFLRHLLGDRPARIVPVLCGLGQAQARGEDPAGDGAAESFVEALCELVEERRDRVLLVAGADLAHIGPRFGDPRPLDGAQRRRLEARDKTSIGRALAGDALGFFEHVVEDLGTRRVCGVGPIYTLLRALPGAARGEELHYAQCVDPNEGSIVSHASIGFYVG